MRSRARRSTRSPLRSHRNAAAARDGGRFAKEIFSIEVPGGRRGEIRTFAHDESIRDDTTLEKLAALRPQPGTENMTAGNSSPLSDGASGVVLATAGHAEQLGAKPIARVLASAAIGVDPAIMGIAPAYALPRAIEKAGLTADEIDVY